MKITYGDKVPKPHIIISVCTHFHDIKWIHIFVTVSTWYLWNFSFFHIENNTDIIIQRSVTTFKWPLIIKFQVVNLMYRNEGVISLQLYTIAFFSKLHWKECFVFWGVTVLEQSLLRAILMIIFSSCRWRY